MVVGDVPGQDVSQVALAEDEDMVKTLSPDRADEAFREGILPRTSGSREHFWDLHTLYTLVEGVPVDRIAIAQEVGRAESSGKVSTIC
jgi:hypothetical protein